MLTFADVAIDLDAREVIRDGASQHLEPQAFDLLRYLILNQERVVPKSELLDAVWGTTSSPSRRSRPG
ncbi:MAG: winged helix-turn-helix domain-containing protein [Euzebya tangerina]